MSYLFLFSILFFCETVRSLISWQSYLLTGDSSASSAQLFRGSVQSIHAFSAAAEVGVSSSNAVVAREKTFIPDYTVRAIADVVYFRVTRSLYQASHSATLLERCSGTALPNTSPAGDDSKPVVDVSIHLNTEE